MQTSTGKEMIVRKEEIGVLLNEAVESHQSCEAARRAAGKSQQIALWHGWRAGVRLNKIKSMLPSGDWLDWLDLNFCRPCDVTIRTAQIYMKIDSDNAALRQTANTKRVSHVEPDLQLLSKLKFDTIRKHAIGFVPEKSQPQHQGNAKFARLVSFLNIANEYARLKQRHVDGLQLVDFDEAREETVELYQFLSWLHGHRETSPWVG
jgi:hypothetical protein